jgi:hypothetical protein
LAFALAKPLLGRLRLALSRFGYCMEKGALRFRAKERRPSSLTLHSVANAFLATEFLFCPFWGERPAINMGGGGPKIFPRRRWPLPAKELCGVSLGLPVEGDRDTRLEPLGELLTGVGVGDSHEWDSVLGSRDNRDFFCRRLLGGRWTQARTLNASARLNGSSCQRTGTNVH